MRRSFLTALFFAAPVVALAGEADGVWKTAPGDDGGYLYVTIGACASDAGMSCGTITHALNSKGADPGYAHLGKPILWDMHAGKGGAYSGGKVWDPEHDKTYSSHMKLKGDVLDVEGCISIICSGQDWTRVK